MEPRTRGFIMNQLISSLMKLPILFVCENGLAVHSFQKDRQSFNISRHAKAYDIESEYIAEGYDFCTIHEKTLENLDLIKSNGMPRLLEIETFRYCEHVESGKDFNAGYRSSNDFETWKCKDPLITDDESIKRFLQKFTRRSRMR